MRPATIASRRRYSASSARSASSPWRSSSSAASSARRRRSPRGVTVVLDSRRQGGARRDDGIFPGLVLRERLAHGPAVNTPSGPSPVAVGATANVTCPRGPTLTTGYSVSDAMRSPPGSASPTPTTSVRPAALAERDGDGLWAGPRSTADERRGGAVGADRGPEPEVHDGAARGRRRIGRGATPRADVRCRSRRSRPRPARTSACRGRRSTPPSLSAMRSENFAKMPPIGESSPAPTIIWMRSPVAHEDAAGHRLALDHGRERHLAGAR